MVQSGFQSWLPIKITWGTVRNYQQYLGFTQKPWNQKFWVLVLSINSYFFQSIPTFSIMHIEASLVTQTVKNLSAMQETQKFSHWVRKILWRRKWLPTPIFLPGEFHGQRNLVGYSPWGHKELDMTEWLTFFMCVHKSTKNLRWFSVAGNFAWAKLGQGNRRQKFSRRR